MEHGLLYIGLASLFGLFMAWGVGANDVANAMGTSVGSKALSIKQAIIIAAIFEFAGALLAGGQVTHTIRAKIVDPQVFLQNPQLLVYGMLAALLAAGVWLLIASYFAWPVSTTHSIVGAIIGFAIADVGFHAVYWHKVTGILASWVVTPFIAGVLAFLIFRSIQRLILEAEDPLYKAKHYLPIYVFVVAFIIVLVTLNKGLQHIGLALTTAFSYGAAFLLAVCAALLSFFLLRKVKPDPEKHREFHYVEVERVFGILMIFTACSMAFAHGSNDVANAIGPLAAIVHVVRSAGSVAAVSIIPLWVLLLGAVGIVLGLATYGYRVISTVGTRITQLTPSRGFAAELATASTVVLATGTGLPVSTTQTLVGAILGVGMARGIAALQLNVIGNIFLSWVITLPAGALLSIGFFYCLKLIFGA